jgi:hypothetical protein
MRASSFPFLAGSGRVRMPLRADQPDLEYDSAGHLRPTQKYVSPAGLCGILNLVSGAGPWLLNGAQLPNYGRAS